MLDHLRSRDPNLARGALALALAGTFVVVQGCSSDESPANPADSGTQTDGGSCTGGGGPDPGMAVDHCMGTFQETGMCMSAPPDGGEEGDGGAEPEPDTNVGREADDDDCKYHVSFTNDCVLKGGTGTTFTVTLKSATGTKALVPNAKTSAEAFIGNHPADVPDGVETSPGVYKVGPIVFDQGGKWTVRFHFFEDCSDVPEDSPHGHAAFFINVPN
jgi:hypothetical protein